jgi:2-keto-4-pentenoate hydratase/2-oxohepta-3-ene-1,7-dioic acid hydratase in catechol pathway
LTNLPQLCSVESRPEQGENDRLLVNTPRFTGTNGLPIDVPSKIICVGLNYRDHASEAAQEVPNQPLLFAKWPSALIGPGETIHLPDFAAQVDYEAELGVVIGHAVRNISPENALEAVAGFICVNDVSARDIQFLDGQWTRGKSFDSFCPVGPHVTPVGEVLDPQALRIRCLVNGELVQDDSTASMIFPVSQLIAFASRAMQLQPGDLIATGTPAGVQLGRDSPRWLADGDVVTVEIEGVGTLTNPVSRNAVALGKRSET